MTRFALALLLTTTACSSTSSNPPTGGVVVADAGGDAEDDTRSGDETLPATDASPSGDSAAGNDATTSGDGAPAMEDAGADACNALRNDAPTIDAEYVSGPMPTPKGGTIVDGVYVRTRNVTYADAPFSPFTDQTLAWFHGGTADFVQTLSTRPTERYTATYVTEGSALILTRTCSMTTKSPFDRYDATPTSIVFYDLVSKKSLHYTRR